MVEIIIFFIMTILLILASGVGDFADFSGSALMIFESPPGFSGF